MLAFQFRVSLFRRKWREKTTAFSAFSLSVCLGALVDFRGSFDAGRHGAARWRGLSVRAPFYRAEKRAQTRCTTTLRHTRSNQLTHGPTQAGGVENEENKKRIDGACVLSGENTVGCSAQRGTERRRQDARKRRRRRRKQRRTHETTQGSARTPKKKGRKKNWKT